MNKGIDDHRELFDQHSNIWSHTYRIRSHEVDPCGQLSLPPLFHLMQDAASSHAKALGLSVSRLLDEGYTWVLSRLILNILEPLPGWEDQISVHTWPSGNQGPFALRDVLLKNSADQTIATALSGWLVIDAKTRKPQRIEPYSKILRPITGHHVITKKLDKISVLQRIDHKCQFNVRRSDLDINEHVNNVSYIGWILETLPGGISQKMDLKTIVLNFMGEARQGDQVISTAEANEADSSKAKEDHSGALVFLHRIFRQSDQQELFRAKSVWKEKLAPKI